MKCCSIIFISILVVACLGSPDTSPRDYQALQARIAEKSVSNQELQRILEQDLLGRLNDNQKEQVKQKIRGAGDIIKDVCKLLCDLNIHFGLCDLMYPCPAKM